MRGQEDSNNYYEESYCQAVQLDYKDESINALVILPKGSLDEYLKDFNSFELLHIQDKMKKRKLLLIMPEFELEFTTQLNEVLSLIGIRKAFNAEEADFGNLFEEQRTSFISQVLHKTFLKVDKIGTQAGAFTCLNLVGCIPPSMIVCKPFLFVIINKNYPSHCIFIATINDVSK